MRNVLKLMSVLLSMAGLANATVVLQDDFTGTTVDTTKWSVMNNGNNVNVSINPETSELEIAFQSAMATACYGVKSNEKFSITGNQKLIIDTYGTNYYVVDSVNHTSSAFSTPLFGASSTNVSSGYTTLYEDWAYVMEGYLSWLKPSNPGIWTDELCTLKTYDGGKTGAWTDGGAGPESYTLGKYCHSIITIDKDNVNFYFKDSAYDESMTPNATIPTSAAFSADQLANGLYVYLMAYSFGNDWKSYEMYDGVQVSVVPEPVTISLLLSGLCFGGLLRRK